MKERYYHIDSRHKYGTSTTTNPITWRFPDTLRGLQSMQVIEAVVPNSMHTVPPGNKLTFIYNMFDTNTNALSTEDFKFEVGVAPGAYSAYTLSSALNNEINKAITSTNIQRDLNGQTRINDSVYVEIPGHTGFVSLVVIPGAVTVVPGRATFVTADCSAFYNVVLPSTTIEYTTLTGALVQARSTRSTKVIQLAQPSAVFLSVEELHDAAGTIEVSPEAPLGNRKGIVARLNNPGDRFELTHKYDQSNRSIPTVYFTRPDVSLSQLTLSWVDSDGKLIDLNGAHWTAYVRIVANF